MSEKGSDPNAIPWTYHLYRPEALMLYILGILALIFYFMDRPDLNLTRLYPMEDGTALAVGMDDQDTENPLLQVWLTGIDEKAEWIRELEGNYVPPPENGLDIPIFAYSQKRGYLLVGEDSGRDQRMAGIVSLNLDNGELLWSNYEQPSGDAQFGSVFTWEDQLVTTHFGSQSGKKRIYVVGRKPENGSMIWTKVFSPPANISSPWQNSISLLPGKILVDMDSLRLLDIATGDVLHTWAGEAPSFNGGWIFYQYGNEFHTLESSSLADSLLYSYGRESVNPDQIPAPEPLPKFMPIQTAHDNPVPGYSGFFEGFPIHFGELFGLRFFSPAPMAATTNPGEEISPSDSSTSQTPVTRAPEGKFTAIPLPTVFPNGLAAPVLNTRNGFLTQDWPRYLPLFCSLFSDDTLKKYFPETMADRSLAGDRLVILDLKFLRPALVGKQLLEEPWSGQMVTFADNHYFIGTDPEKPSNPLILQFDGNTGGLRKALTSNREIKGLKPTHSYLPAGNRIWIAGDKEWAALSVPDLELVFTTSEDISFRDVSTEYREKLGYNGN